MGTSVSTCFVNTRDKDNGVEHVSKRTPCSSCETVIVQSVNHVVSTIRASTSFAHYQKLRGSIDSRLKGPCEKRGSKRTVQCKDMKHRISILVKRNEDLHVENTRHVNEINFLKHHLVQVPHHLTQQYCSSMFFMMLYGNMTGVIRKWLEMIPSSQYKLFINYLLFSTEVYQFRNFMYMLVKKFGLSSSEEEDSVIQDHGIVYHKAEIIYKKFLITESDYYIREECTHNEILAIRSRNIPINIFSNIENTIHSKFIKNAMPQFLHWFQDNTHIVRDFVLERRNMEYSRTRNRSGSFRMRNNSIDNMETVESEISSISTTCSKTSTQIIRTVDESRCIDADE